MLSVSYTFSPTTVIQSAQANQNFTDIVNYINNTACVAGMGMFWTGSIATIPTGWILDTNSRDMFIIGAGNLYNPGDTGGETTHLLTGAESGEKGHSQTVAMQSGSNGRNDGSAPFFYPGGSTSVSSVVASDASQAHNNMPPWYAYAIIKKS
jgi:hypothetical protein